MSFGSLLFVSCPIALVNTVAVMPFDVVKTHLQKANAQNDQRVVKTMISLVKKYRFSVLYTGWQVKFAHSFIQAAFTVPLLEMMQQRWEK